MIWLLEETNKHEIKLLKIDTVEQLGDIVVKVEGLVNLLVVVCPQEGIPRADLGKCQ